MQKMADALRARQVGKGEFYCYVGITIIGIMYIAGFMTVTPYSYEPSYLKIIELITTIAGIAISLAISYFVNKRGDDKDLWYRYFSLGFPIGIATLLVTLIVYIAATAFNFVDDEIYSYPDLAISFFLYALIFYWTYKYMRYIANPN